MAQPYQILRRLLVPLALFPLLFTSCQTAQMALSDDLKTNATEMAVKGRQGLLINQKLNFGPYRVYDVHRGWVKSHNINIFFYNTAGSKQKFEFTFADADSNVWTAFCSAKVKTKEFDLRDGIWEAFNPNKYTEVAVGTLTSDKYGTWNLLLTDKADWRQFRRFDGMLSNSQHQLQLKPVQHVATSRIPTDDIVGYEFLLNGKPVGAVELLNNGRVWLKEELDPDVKAAIAGASSYLLLAENLEEHLNKLKTQHH